MLKQSLSLSFVLLLGASLFSACTGTKQVTQTSPTPEKVTSSFVTEVASKAVQSENIVAKISANVNADGKKVSLGGSLRMRRNEVIRLQLTFLGIAEVATLEFTPTGVLIIDRIHKQYIRARYDQLDFLAQAGLDFYSLQSLFWAELFVPGEHNVTTALHRFTTSQSGDYTLLTRLGTSKLEYHFLVTTATRALERLTVRSTSTQNTGQFVTRYGAYTNLGKDHFPSSISLSATGIGKEFSLALSLSSLSTASNWEVRTIPPTKYTERSAEDAFRSLFDF